MNTDIFSDDLEAPHEVLLDHDNNLQDPHSALSFDLPDAAVFRATTSRITLTQVLASAEVELQGTALRDTRSAFAALARAGVDLAGTVATPARSGEYRSGPWSTRPSRNSATANAP